MNTRATNDHLSVLQRSRFCCRGAVLPWLMVLSLSGCVGNQLAPVRQGEEGQRPLAEWEKPLQEVDQKLEGSRAAMAEMQRRLAAQEAEMRLLRGNLEVVQHENQALREQAREQPVAEQKIELPPYAQTSIQPGTTGTQQPATVPLPAVPVAAAKPESPPAAATPAKPATPAVASATPAASAAAGKSAPAPVKPDVAGQAPPATPQQLYDAAFLLLKGGQYKASREGFERFLEKYPDDTLSDNAQYWIGELYSVQKQYPEALLAFNQVLVRWPTSPKVPPSLLKVGFAFYELGDMANARASLTKLINDYPDSSAVAMARQRLQEIAQKEKESPVVETKEAVESKGAAPAKERAPEKVEAKPEPPGSKRAKRLAGE